MVIETSCFLQLDDLLGFEIRCEKCGDKQLHYLSSDTKLPCDCSSCGKSLFRTELGGWASVKELKIALLDLMNRKPKNLRILARGLPGKQ
jgi:ribosomal protein S27E